MRTSQSVHTRRLVRKNCATALAAGGSDCKPSAALTICGALAASRMVNHGDLASGKQQRPVRHHSDAAGRPTCFCKASMNTRICMARSASALEATSG